VKLSVKKQDLHSVATIATKLVGKYTQVYLYAKNKQLWLVINSDFYVKAMVPSAKVEIDGLISIQAEIFTRLFAMRGETMKMVYDDRQNKLDVSCGSKVSVYVIAADKSDIKAPSIGEADTVELKATVVSDIALFLKRCKFLSPDVNVSDYAVISNSKKDFTVKYASTNSCAFYTRRKKLGDNKFEVTIPVTQFSEAFSLCSAKVIISIADNLLMLSSDTLIATFPSLQEDSQDNIQDQVKNVTPFVEESARYLTGFFIFEPKELAELLKSIQPISGGADVVELRTSGDILFLSLEAKFGKSKDKTKLIKNSLKEITVEVPELFLEKSISMCGAISSEAKFFLSSAKNFYKMTADSDELSFVCLGPIS
jgi:hypothetical protein